MRAPYLGPGWDTVHVRGVPYNTGDGFSMALDIGAMPYGSWSTCHASPQDIAIPKFTMPSAHVHSESMHRYMYPYAIMVNLKGERFVDESWDTRGRTYASMGREILAQPVHRRLCLGLGHDVGRDVRAPRGDCGEPGGGRGTLSDRARADFESAISHVRGFERGMSRGQTRHRHAKRRAGDVIEACAVAEVDTARVAAVLAADPDLEITAAPAPELDADLHQPSDTALVDGRKRIAREYALLQVLAQEAGLGVVP